MKKRQIIKTAGLAFLLLAGGSPIAFAQVFDGALATPVAFGSPQFFICVIAGVLLAIGFQVLLTILSAAAGISLVGNVNRFNQNDPSKADGNTPSNRNAENGHGNKTPAVVKIGGGLGIWTLITVSLSLFFASWLAVKLSLVADNTIGVTLGLVIWAAFFTLMAYLEMKSVSTLIGGIFHVALQGLRSSFRAVSSVFGSSPQVRTSQAIEDAATAVRKEIMESLDNSQLVDKLENYLDRMQAREPDYDRMRKELAGLLDEVELREVTGAATGR